MTDTKKVRDIRLIEIEIEIEIEIDVQIDRKYQNYERERFLDKIITREKQNSEGKDEITK